MSNPQQLLAKSARGTKRLTLLQHLCETEEAVCALFAADTRWAKSFLRFFKLEACDYEVFMLHAQIAALFHDVGKANEDFQSMITSRTGRQSLRHEHLSALLLCEPAVSAWVGANPRIDLDVIAAAVLTHHLKATNEGDEFQVLLPRHSTPTRLYFDDGQVRDTFARVAQTAGLPAFKGSLPVGRYHDASWGAAHDALFDRAHQFFLRLRKDGPRRRLSLAVKAALIASDSVSSGLWREDVDLLTWIRVVAHRPALGRDDIYLDVVSKRICELESRAKWSGWHRFQDGAALVGRRGLLLAACGAGKTLAAWRWASSVSQSEPIGRVVFLYPTRGTATEGFRDYVAHAPEGDAALVHGTSEYELVGMMANPDDLPVSLRGKRVVTDENEARLFALGLWNKRYFSATVDQFLGFMENGYRGICLLPALADAAVVFDEIHSYDRKLWNALIAFLENFDVPVLCMTATLPPTRRDQLERRCELRSYPSRTEMLELSDLEAKEAFPRYRHTSTSMEVALTAAVDTVNRGGRVLWVVNTVLRCQRLAVRLRRQVQSAQQLGVYHSRFKLDDRQRRHRDTVDAFRTPSGGQADPAIAVTTQVCEMSLDLDADLLISEFAPISSLVQRFGRAHRHLRRDPSFRATLMTYAPESALPYGDDEIQAASAFLRALGDGDISQRDLARELEQHALPERHARGSTSFVDGGYFAIAGDLRESDDFGVQVVLDSNLEDFRTLTKRGAPTAGLILTVPRRAARDAEASGLPAWLKTADGTQYDSWLGFVDDQDLLLELRSFG